MQTSSVCEATGLQPLSKQAERPVAPAATAQARPLWVGVLAALAAAGAISFLFWTMRARLLAPFGDDHDWLDLALRQVGDPNATYLFTPHNGQVIAWARGLAWLGRRGGENGWFAAAGAVSMIVEALTLSLVVIRLTPGRVLGVALGTIAGLLVLDGVAVQDAAWPVFSVYAFVAVFAVSSLAAFAMRRPGRLGSFSLWTSLGCAVGASLGNAAGFVVWPVLVWSAVRQREDQRIVLLLVVATALALACGVHGMTLAQGRSNESAGIGHLVKMVRYFGGYCAMPWSGGSAHLAPEVAGWLAAVGAVGLALAPSAEADPFRAVTALGRGLIVFGLVTAAMASVGRVNELPTPVVPTRYVVFADMLHAGMLLAASPWLSQTVRRWPTGFQTAFLLAALALLGQEQVAAAKIARSADRIRAASVAFDRGDRSARVVALVYPQPDAAARIRRALRKAP